MAFISFQYYTLWILAWFCILILCTKGCGLILKLTLYTMNFGPIFILILYTLYFGLILHPDTIHYEFWPIFHPNTLRCGFWPHFHVITIHYQFWPYFHPNTIHCEHYGFWPNFDPNIIVKLPLSDTSKQTPLVSEHLFMFSGNTNTTFLTSYKRALFLVPSMSAYERLDSIPLSSRPILHPYSTHCRFWTYFYSKLICYGFWPDFRSSTKHSCFTPNLHLMWPIFHRNVVLGLKLCRPTVFITRK